jgi:hypothetical protein
VGYLYRGGFRSLPTLGYADKDALALVQTRDARLLKRTKTSFPPPSLTMKPNPLAA